MFPDLVLALVVSPVLSITKPDISFPSFEDKFITDADSNNIFPGLVESRISVKKLISPPTSPIVRPVDIAIEPEICCARPVLKLVSELDKDSFPELCSASLVAKSNLPPPLPEPEEILTTPAMPLVGPARMLYADPDEIESPTEDIKPPADSVDAPTNEVTPPTSSDAVPVENRISPEVDTVEVVLTDISPEPLEEPAPDRTLIEPPVFISPEPPLIWMEDPCIDEVPAKILMAPDALTASPERTLTCPDEPALPE